MTSTIETDNTDDAVNADGSPTVPPTAAKRPHTRTHHGDTFTDPYEWMRDKDSPELKEYVAQQNAYTEAKLSHLEPLRERLFEEFRSRIEETDMSVPTRMDGYWYYARTVAGQQYAIQCRLPIRGSDDWDPPEIDPKQPAGTTPGEQIVLDANQEAKGHDFFAIGGMDISKDGRWMLLGTDTSGDERYDYVIREIATGQDLPEHFDGIASACFTPDARYVFTTHLDDAQRPYQVRRHKVGTPVAEDVTVYTEQDERFWTGCGISFDDRHIVISTGSKTTSEVLMLPTSDPEGDFVPFIERQEGTEYDVSFGTFEAAGPSNEDIPLAIVYHNAHNPNFEIDVIDLRSSEPPYRLGDGQVVAVGSPYGTERGDDALAGASQLPPSTPFDDPRNPTPLRGARGLAIEGIGMHRHYVAMSYRADGLPHLAVMTKAQAAADFLAGRPWSFTELTPPPLDGDWD
ncbi:MAG: S9 family peptidase, partial [Bifidobacterium sp.]|nr:S9 family peptidase [Bifidobacterium sp.]